MHLYDNISRRLKTASTKFAPDVKSLKRLLSATITLSNKEEDPISVSSSGLAQVEDRLAEQRDRKLKYCEKIKGLEYKTESSDEYIEILKKKLDLIKKEKEGLDSKLTGFQTASKHLDSLLESQRLDKNKEGLGYSVVPPPLAQIYSSPKKDLSWTGLLEFADDTIIDYSRPSPAIESNTDDTNKNSSISKTRESPSIITSKPAIKFVKAAERPTTGKVEAAKKPVVKYAELYRKTTKRAKLEDAVRTKRSRGVVDYILQVKKKSKSYDNYSRMVPAAANVKE
uniref:Uncharacterized protein n=1 Tax=Tanacetum cinerariifolium TaxID=118510 RepID=A0A6L2NL55_TANCI|nr:hypothetical protein [Tanacetum cinerariifolium]